MRYAEKKFKSEMMLVSNFKFEKITKAINELIYSIKRETQHYYELF